MEMKISDRRRRKRVFSMEPGGLPLVSTFALLSIVAGQLQGSSYMDQQLEPEFLSPSQNMTVAVGRDVHFTCTVNQLGSYRVAWIKSDTKTILAIHTHMVTQNPRLSVTHNGHNTWKLYITSVEPKDSGTYMCQINTDPMMSQMGHLSVVIPPDIADDSESTAGAPEGGSVELRCTATGVPEPTVSWKRLGGRPIVFRDEQGTEIEEGPLPSVLQEVQVPVINNTACEAMYQAAGYNEHIPNIFICAGWRKGGSDSCEGDSGGPMVIQRDRDKRFVLGGVISWGIGCAEPNQPGVYTRISEFRDWINQILQF